MSKQTFTRLALAVGLIGALAPGQVSAQTETEEPCRASDGADDLPETEDDGFECGRGADAVGEGATAIGDLALASRPQTTALGREANATADRSTAIGDGAVADYVSSVALGAGSVADTEDSVSVGNTTLKRRITNMADGVASSDAATFGQLTAAVAAIQNPVDLTVANSISIDNVTTRAIPTNLNGSIVPADIGQIYIGNTTQSADAITIDSGANFPGGIAFRRYQGEASDPQPVTIGTQLGYLDFRGYNDGVFYNAGSLDMVVDGSIFDTSGLMPTKMRFAVSDGLGVTTPMELLGNGRLELNSAGNPVGILGDPRLYVFQSSDRWNTVLASSGVTGDAFVLRLHSTGEDANDYLIGGSSGAGSGSFKFSVRGNGDTHISGQLFAQGRDVLDELTGLTVASLDQGGRLDAVEGDVADLQDMTTALANQVDTNTAAIAANTQAIEGLQGQAEAVAGTLQLFKFGSAGTANATGSRALAVGGNAGAQGTGALAVGYDSQAASSSATAVGSGSKVGANSDNSVALGGGAVVAASAPNAIALGGNARAEATASTALGANSQAISVSSTALGNGAVATGVNSAALSANTRANGVSALAMGGSALANGSNSTAIGGTAQATSAGATAIGSGAAAIRADSVAIGSRAVAQGNLAVGLGNSSSAVGDRSLAVGSSALASATTSSAFGTSSQATGAGATALGSGAKAIRDDAVAVGNNNIAQGAKAIALGNGAAAVADRGSALGAGAVVTHQGSTAVGAGARTTAANQVMLGGSGTSVVVADIAASTAAQQGPVDVVTIDSAGTLGRQQAASVQSVAEVRSSVDYIAAVSDAQFMSLSNDVTALTGRLGALEQNVAMLDERIASSTAVAVAMSGGTFLPDQRFNLTANVGTYDGAHAGAFQIGALLNDHVAVNAGVATGFNKQGKTAGRVGVSLGF